MAVSSNYKSQGFPPQCQGIQCPVLKRIQQRVIDHAHQRIDHLKSELEKFEKKPIKYIHKRIRKKVQAFKHKIVQIKDKCEHAFEYAEKISKVYRGIQPFLQMGLWEKIVPIPWLHQKISIIELLGETGVKISEGLKHLATATKLSKAVNVPLAMLSATMSAKDILASLWYRDKEGVIVNFQSLLLNIGDAVDDALGIYSLICSLAGVQEIAIVSQVGIPLALALLGGSVISKLTGIMQCLYFERDVNRLMDEFDGHREKPHHIIGKIILPEDPYTISDKDIQYAIYAKGFGVVSSDEVRQALNEKVDELQLPDGALKEVLVEVRKKFAAKQAIVMGMKLSGAIPMHHEDHFALRDRLLHQIQTRIGATPAELWNMSSVIYRRGSFKATGLDLEELHYEYLSILEQFEGSKGKKFNKFMKHYAEVRGLKSDDPKIKFFKQLNRRHSFTVKRKQRIYGWKAGSKGVKELSKMEKTLQKKQRAGIDLHQDEVDKLYRGLQGVRSFNRRMILGKVIGIVSKACTIAGLVLLYTGYTTIAAPILLIVGAVIDLALLFYKDLFASRFLNIPKNYEGKEPPLFPLGQLEKLKNFIQENRYVPDTFKEMQADLLRMKERLVEEAKDVKYRFWDGVTDNETLQDLSYQAYRVKKQIQEVQEKIKEKIGEVKQLPERIKSSAKEAICRAC